MTFRETMARMNPFAQRMEENELERLNGLLEIATGSLTLGAFGSYTQGNGYGSFNAVPPTAFRNSTLFRVIVLISQSFGWMMANANVRVTDREGNRIANRRTERVLNLVTGYPDGETPSSQFWSDYAMDFCTYGNSFGTLDRDIGFVPTKITFMNADDADVMITGMGNREYTLSQADIDGREMQRYNSRNVLHAKWPRIGRFNAVRPGFGPSPVALVRDAIFTDYVLQMKARDIPTRPHVATILERVASDDKKGTNIARILKAHFRLGSTDPLYLTQKGTLQSIQDTITPEGLVKLTELQAKHVSRIYGITGPVAGEDATNWGTGISELIRANYRFGLRGHYEAMKASVESKCLLPGQHFAFDETVLVSGDYKALTMLANGLRGNGKTEPAISGKELRRIFGMPLEIDGKPLAMIGTGMPGGSPAEPSDDKKNQNSNSNANKKNGPGISEEEMMLANEKRKELLSCP